MTRIKNVKNTTKFERSIKAISPVIATLLMIAIAVVASLVVYAWVTGYMGNTTSKAGKAIQIQSFASQGGNLVIYVQNVGQGDVELNRDQSVYVNSNLIPLRSTMQAKIPIIAGQTVELLTDFAYTAGTKVNIKVTTTDGTFMTATGTGGSSNPTTPATTYAVNFVLDAGGLSMNPSGPQTVGGTIAITTTEISGYHFTSWSSSTGSITFGDDSLASTSATINGAGTVTANFAVDTVQYSVTFAMSGDAGAVINPTGAHPYDAGSSVPITATASSGYHFTSWSSSTGSITFGDDSLASTSATINGAGTVTANFAVDTVQYSVTFAMSGDAGAVINPTGAHPYDAGSSVPITATASSGYHFTSWSSSTGSITFGDDSLASTSATINGAGTVTANFAVNTPMTITLRPNAAGSTTQLDDRGTTPNYACVNENPDNPTYYVRGTLNDNWQYDSYDIADQSLSGTINSVTVYISVRKEGSSTNSNLDAYSVIRLNNGAVHQGTNRDISAVTSYTVYNDAYTVKPSELGGGAWTWSDINALEIGAALRSHDSGYLGWTYAECTQVWVVINYTP